MCGDIANLRASGRPSSSAISPQSFHVKALLRVSNKTNYRQLSEIAIEPSETNVMKRKSEEIFFSWVSSDLSSRHAPDRDHSRSRLFQDTILADVNVVVDGVSQASFEQRSGKLLLRSRLKLRYI